ncbi:recombinase family protein [Aerococcaceae bacterium zg-ZUI334]|uniref:recombinase family protein n=1 Tax=Aerococcaceae bacterium zg-252 TaxID=2796928 RepID=UPI001B913FF6|nr:recombinase family protein [Aerococcaceae bacterium zg-ZUI334]
MTERKVVKVIPAQSTVGYGEQLKEQPKKKVAAYCRVSTDSEEQASSYEAQVEYYTNYIQSKSEWVLAGIFADDGISGTNTKKRTEFNRMIQSCKEGKIDLIITKSISRFARNTLDCLHYIRQLKEYKIPVYFEKENINTMDSKGEVLLTIMASLAQQESESISKNVKMGIQYRYQKGEVRVNHNRFLGYTKDDNGQLIIEPSEAIIIKRIFKEYLDGKSLQKIADGLMADNIMTAANRSLWRAESVRKILANEKYMGDALLQKTYTVDVLSKKRVVNNGIVPQYYVENSHEGIISKEVFHKVQVELQRRVEQHKGKNKNKSTYSSKYALSNVVICQECESAFRRVQWSSKGKNSVNWRCKTRINKGAFGCCVASINEIELQNMIVRVINKMMGNRHEVLEVINQKIETVLNKDCLSLSDIQLQIEHLQKALEISIQEEKDYSHILEQLDQLKEQRINLEQQANIEKEEQSRLHVIKKHLEQQSTLVTEYDESIVRKLVDKVVVGNDDVEIMLKSGKTMKLKRYRK